jgi:hypothetical protein
MRHPSQGRIFSPRGAARPAGLAGYGERGHGLQEGEQEMSNSEKAT